MRKLKFLSLLMMISIYFVSCTKDKEGYLKNFEKFVRNVQSKKEISASELNKLSDKFYKFSVFDYDKFEEELTDDDKQMIVNLKADYYKTVAIFE